MSPLGWCHPNWPSLCLSDALQSRAGAGFVAFHSWGALGVFFGTCACCLCSGIVNGETLRNHPRWACVVAAALGLKCRFNSLAGGSGGWSTGGWCTPVSDGVHRSECLYSHVKIQVFPLGTRR